MLLRLTGLVKANPRLEYPTPTLLEVAEVFAYTVPVMEGVAGVPGVTMLLIIA
jgi:hypothetical protein